MRSYSHLSEDERDQIGVLRAAGSRSGPLPGRSVGQKPPSPGSCSGTRSPGGYSPLHAAGAYQLRRRREAILEREAALRLFVGDRLAEGWTPEQISGWLKSGNEPRLRAIGCETIYAFIYRTAQKAEALWRYLTRRHKRRRSRRARPARDTIKDRASIHDRPKTIESRGEAGHWESDLIICKCTRPVLVLHERKSRVTLAARLAGKTAAETISAMLAVFGRIDPHLRRSITFDNDTAFAQHRLLRTMRDMTTWFATLMPHGKKAASKTPMDAYVDGCRATSISTAHPTRTSEIVLTTNLTPRKCLGFKTPFQALLAELGKDVQIASLKRVALRSGPDHRHIERQARHFARNRDAPRPLFWAVANQSLASGWPPRLTPAACPFARKEPVSLSSQEGSLHLSALPAMSRRSPSARKSRAN